MEADVGKRVRRVRRAKDLTQAQLAAQAELNVITISRLENGTAKVVYGDTIVALARALGVSADYLLGLSEREEGGVTDTVTDTSAARQMLEQGLRAGTITDTLPIRRLLKQEFEAFLDARTPLVQAILQAQPVTDTVTDTHGQPGGVSGATRTTHGVTDTVTDTESVTDTVTVTGHTLETFDTSKFYLGKLCPHGHDYAGTGQSLLRKHNQHCRECENASRREKRQARRQATAL